MTTYLGIDYGRVHLGLAYAEHTLATPLPPHPNDATFSTHLRTLIHAHQITHLIVGLPTGPLVAEIKAFAARLTVETNLPVILFDETLSTHEAQQQLRASGASRRKRHDEHSYAAAIILEDYLESATLNPSQSHITTPI